MDEMIQSIKEFREAAENFMARSRADREQDILSTLAKIRSDIKQLEEDLMPLGLVSGQTHETVKMRIDYMTKALLRGPDDDLPFDLSSLHHKLTNDINLIKAHCTQQRRNLVSGRRLLSLDGGGVRGICSLLVLKGLMKAIQAVEEDKEFRLEGDWVLDKGSDRDLPLPKDYFDLVGGTSTGGLIAIMLFRLGMPIHLVIEKYTGLSNAIFEPGISRFLGGTFIKPFFNRPWFSGSKLETEVKNVLRDQHEDEGAMMQTAGVECQAFVCAVTKNTHHTVNFRTYNPHDLTKSYHIPCTVVQAARATSAAPFYFPSKKISRITFWDGGLQNNNPICQVLAENGSGIPAVVVSLGTGIPQRVLAKKPQKIPRDPEYAELVDLENPRFSWPVVSQVQAVLAFVTNAENEHRSFERVLGSYKIPYYRLNPTMEKTVTLSDSGEIGYLLEKTQKYLEKEDVQKMLLEVAKLLLRPSPVDIFEQDDRIHPQIR